MKSRLCILETIKPLKIILDSAMASKMKIIDDKKSSLFNPEDGFRAKKNSWSLGGTKSFQKIISQVTRCVLPLFVKPIHISFVVKLPC